MATSRSLLLALAAAGLAAAQSQSISEQEPLARRILKWSEAEQIAWVNSTLTQGLPSDLGGILQGLADSKSALVLPLIEQKIEQVLRAGSPQELFTDKPIDPQKFVAFAVSAIEDAGNEQALREVSKLLHLDNKLFDDSVQMTLIKAEADGNPFPVAYQGFEIGDPALDARLAVWAEWELADKRPFLPLRYLANRHPSYAEPKPVGDIPIANIRQLWAEALVDRYGGVLSEAQWRSDPIASRLPASMAQSLHNDMIRRTSEIMQKRVTR
jgi:hypothetical protein